MSCHFALHTNVNIVDTENASKLTSKAAKDIFDNIYL